MVHFFGDESTKKYELVSLKKVIDYDKRMEAGKNYFMIVIIENNSKKFKAGECRELLVSFIIQFKILLLKVFFLFIFMHTIFVIATQK